MPRKLHPVVLCGGSGTRLWPMSRRTLPKQFVPLVTERSLLQDTVARVAAMSECQPPIVVSNNEHRFMVAEQIAELGVRPAALILEPVGRNTAPATAVAALRLGPDELLLVLPSDHAIADAAKFQASILAAARIAEQGLLATFGVRPTGPNTGYGYIEVGELISGESFRIRRFIEKPAAEQARRYVKSGGFFWNSGIFLFSAGRYLEELGKFRPDILAAAKKALGAAVEDLDFLRLDAAAFEACPSASIDYAVMEKTASGAVVRCEMGWSDVGSWSALWDLGTKDAAGNVTRGEVRLQDASACYVWGASRLVYGLGIHDLIVVETDDAVLVSERSRAQEVKNVVEQLDRERRSEHLEHRRAYRPWGYFEEIDAGRGFKVKRLMVKPRQALSLQLHRKRAEHWVVVSGRARVTRDSSVEELAERQSTFIPVGVKHRLENPGDAPLYVIEVQTGGYLGEDDIERFDDRYGRA